MVTKKTVEVVRGFSRISAALSVAIIGISVSAPLVHPAILYNACVINAALVSLFVSVMLSISTYFYPTTE